MENQILAKVNGKEITQKDMDFLLNSIGPERAAQFANPNGMEQLLHELINQELFFNDAIESKLNETAEFAEEVERLKTHVLKGLVVKNLLDSIEASDEEIKAYYEENAHSFMKQEEVRASHILVPEEETAKALLEQLKNGADFETLAMEESTCPSKEKGGDLGFFSRGKMVPEFEIAAFNLEVNGISEVVQSQFGFHIIKVTDKQEPQNSELSEVSHRIEHDLITKKQQEVYMKRVEELSKKYAVEIINPTV